MFSVAYFCRVLTNTGLLGTIYKTAGIKFYENFFSHSGIISWQSWQGRFFANAWNNALQANKASDLALYSHCLILKVRHYENSKLRKQSAQRHSVTSQKICIFSNTTCKTSNLAQLRMWLGPSFATLLPEPRLSKTRRIKGENDVSHNVAGSDESVQRLGLYLLGFVMFAIVL
jgi:hypothetical protein